MINKEEYRDVINIPLAIIFASSIIILFTTGVNDENALTGLLRGYFGLVIGVIFLLILSKPQGFLFDIFPFILLLGIIALMITYIYIYFDRIEKGIVSGYYTSFSILSTIFLAVQFIILTSGILNKYSKPDESNQQLLSDRNFSLFTLFSVINYIIVLTIGIVLKFYSTQG